MYGTFVYYLNGFIYNLHVQWEATRVIISSSTIHWLRVYVMIHLVKRR